MALKMLSLFSGIGGIDLAAQWAGIETVAFCEIDKFCQKVLRKHWPDVPIFDDIRTLNKKVLEDAGISGIDIVAGGYPCQPYSCAGQRKGEDDDRALWPYMFDRIQEIRPHWFIGENVAGHVTLGLDGVLSDLESEGYTTQPFIIPATGVGAKHRRYRIFTLAYAESQRCRETREHSKRFKKWVAGCSSILPNAEKYGLQRCGCRSIPRESEISFESLRSNRSNTKWNYWEIEPNVGRVAHGIPGRVDRLKSLGNAVVPQQIYPILAAIAEIEKARALEIGSDYEREYL